MRVALPMPVALDTEQVAEAMQYDLEQEIINEDLAHRAAEWWCGDREPPAEYAGICALSLEEYVEAVLAAA